MCVPEWDDVGHVEFGLPVILYAYSIKTFFDFHGHQGEKPKTLVVLELLQWFCGVCGVW